MFIRLSIEDHPTKGWVVQYKEEGISNPVFELYDSTSRAMVLTRYRKIRNSIDHKCFQKLEEKDYVNDTYCKYKPIIMYADTRGLGETKL